MRRSCSCCSASGTGFGWIWAAVADASAAGAGAWPLVPGLVLAGVGLGFLVVPLVNVVLSAVPGELAGAASGIFSTAQQFGGALGIALVVFVRVVDFVGHLGGTDHLQAADPGVDLLRTGVLGAVQHVVVQALDVGGGVRHQARLQVLQAQPSSLPGAERG